MMKYSCFLLTVCISMVCFAEAQKFAETLEKCKKSENATDSDYSSLKNNVKPKTKPMQCLGACIGENLGWIGNKKLNPDGVAAYIKSLPINSDKVQQSVKEIVEECKGVQDADRCVFGDKLLTCLMDGATKRGIKSIYPQ